VIEKCPAGSILGTSFFNEAGENLHKAYKMVCCPASCGECGGEKCGDRPGGANNCCAQKVVNANKCSGGRRLLGGENFMHTPNKQPKRTVVKGFKANLALDLAASAGCVLGDPPPSN